MRSEVGRTVAILCALVVAAFNVSAAVEPAPSDSTATVPPARDSIAGIWRRTDTALEAQVLEVTRIGRAHLGEPGREARGRCQVLAPDTVAIELRTQSGFQRLTCRWHMARDRLTLEIQDARSKTDETDEYRELDQDRSLVGETWGFRRVAHAE